MFLRVFICLFMVGSILASVLMVYPQAKPAQAAQTESKSFALKFYGEDFTVTPRQIKGTPITFKQIKPYIPIVFPDWKKDEGQPIIEIMAFVQTLIQGYEKLYGESIDILAERLERRGFWKGDDIEVLKKELKGYFRHGKMKEAIAKYAPDNASMSYHFAQVQEMYLRHLTTGYIYTLLIESPEGKAAIKEFYKNDKATEDKE